MSYDPIIILRAGEISLTPNGIMLRNWTVNLGGRPGEVSDYRAEMLVAVRDHMVACFDARLMLADDRFFSEDLSGSALIKQIMSAPETVPMPPRKVPWWRRMFGA
jgi:hypothetical protein